MHILRLCIALFCYSLLKNGISKLTYTRFSKDVKKNVGKHVGKDVTKDIGKHVKKLTRFRPKVFGFFCYSLLKNGISKLTDTRFSKYVKKDVGKHVGKHVKKVTRVRPNESELRFEM